MDRSGGGTRKAIAIVHPGLEQLLHAELVSLGIAGARVTEGGVEFTGSLDMIAAVHVRSRLAGRVRLRLGTIKASTLDELAHGLRSMPWKKYAHPRQAVQVEVASRGSRLRRGHAVDKKVSRAIADSLRGPRLAGGRPPREPVVVHLRIVADRAQVSVDASGDRLHRRGWRQATAKAPLRENLAAAMLWAAGWEPGITLVDPMTGSGTFPIEASIWADGRSPRMGWTYAFQRWPCATRVRLPEAKGRATPTTFLGADRDPGALQACQSNARRAKVRNVRWEHLELDDLAPPGGEPGLIIANLPFGRRVAQGRVGDLYERLGHTWKDRWGAWRIALLMARDAPRSRLGLRLNPVVDFVHGGIPVQLWASEGALRIDAYAG